MEILKKNPELATLANAILCGTAGETELRSAKIEDIVAIKTDNSVPHFQMRTITLERMASDPTRSKRYIASDETVDRMGDIVRVKGWNLENYAKNPQVLWAHNHRGLPIGSVVEMHKGIRENKPALIETVQYLNEGVNPEADLVWNLVNSGHIKAVSVGFIPQESNYPLDPEERQALGLGPFGVEFLRQEQIELSNCAVPANPNALGTRSMKAAVAEMVEKGLVSKDVAENLIQMSLTERVLVPVAKIPDPQVSAAPAMPAVSLTTGEVNVDGPKFVMSGPSSQPVLGIKSAPVPVAERDDGTREVTLADVFDLLVELSGRIESIEQKLARPVGQKVPDTRQQLRSAIEAAIHKVGQRLAQEP